MQFSHITVAADLYGCPNRCRHCWLGHSPNGRPDNAEKLLTRISSAFRPFTRTFEIDWWYREPDYPDNYRELWELTTSLSDAKTPHFELASVWRLVRDEGYAKWLAGLGVEAVQLTLFGGEETTDRYTGRRGAYREILEAAEILLAHGIAPRIQTFVNRETLPELPFLEKLLEELALEERCAAIGRPFRYFMHTGSCDGAAENLYDIWLTQEELCQIPETLARYTCTHFGVKRLDEVFGRTEAEWFSLLADAPAATEPTDENPVFLVDHRLDVYPNFTAPAPWWKLGNLETHGAAEILRRYRENESPAQRIRCTVLLGEIVRQCGNPDSRRLFGRGDFIDLMLNRYCRKLLEEKNI